MSGQLSHRVWKTFDCSKGKVLLGARLFFKNEIGKDGNVERVQVLLRSPRVPTDFFYQTSSSLMPTQPSISMVLALMDMADCQGRQLDVEMAYLEADVGEEFYIELPGRYLRSKDQVCKLQKRCTA